MGVTAEGKTKGVKRIVSDTGPILHLGEAQVLGLLEWAGDVLIPTAVDAEMFRYEVQWRNKMPAWIKVEPLVPPYDRESAQWQQAGLIHGGEAHRSLYFS